MIEPFRIYAEQVTAYLFTGRKIIASIFSPFARRISGGLKCWGRALTGSW